MASTKTSPAPINNDKSNTKNNKNLEKEDSISIGDETISSNRDDDDEDNSIEAAKLRIPIKGEGSSRGESGSIEENSLSSDLEESKRLTDDEDGDDDHNHDHRYHSDDEIEHRNRKNHEKVNNDNHINGDPDDDDGDDLLRMPKIGSQFKARSTPNVPLSTDPKNSDNDDHNAVSYTHLTLPTILLV